MDDLASKIRSHTKKRNRAILHEEDDDENEDGNDTEGEDNETKIRRLIESTLEMRAENDSRDSDIVSRVEGLVEEAQQVTDDGPRASEFCNSVKELRELMQSHSKEDRARRKRIEVLMTKTTEYYDTYARTMDYILTISRASQTHTGFDTTDNILTEVPETLC